MNARGLACAAIAFALAGPAVAQPIKDFVWTGQVPIPDNNPAGTGGLVFINVPSDPFGLDTIGWITVGTVTPHTWQGDLVFTLISPGGISTILTDRPAVPQSSFGFSADNFGNPATGERF